MLFVVLQIAKLARWAPTEVFLRDVKTQKLKHALLQGQLLGTEIVAGDELDDRMKAMLRKYPRVRMLALLVAVCGELTQVIICCL